MADRMTAAQMLPLLEAWANRRAELEAQMTALATITGHSGTLYDAVWGAWGDYTTTLSRLIDDDLDWLAWHEAENDMGRKRLEVRSWTRTIKVGTLRQLATVIAGSRS